MESYATLWSDTGHNILYKYIYICSLNACASINITLRMLIDSRGKKWVAVGERWRKTLPYHLNFECIVYDTQCISYAKNVFNS
jgi:hypothetical protein